MAKAVTTEEKPALSLVRYGQKASDKDRGYSNKREFEGVDIKAVYEGKSRSYKAAKRAFDIVASGLGMILLSPVFLGVAIAIRKEDGGPVIFTGMRYGKDMKLFPMHKFRSMCVDAEARTNEFLKDADKNGLAFKIPNDPRETRIGRFIRKTKLDELPQLWNVFKGEMSLVGPRPIQTTEFPLDEYDKQRWVVKPGITCTWQISRKSVVPWKEWVEMDLRYITEMSVMTDLGLLFRTVDMLIVKNGDQGI